MNASHMVNPTPFQPALAAQTPNTPAPHSQRRAGTVAAIPAQLDISPAMAIESVAFSGVDMPVHLVVHRPSLHRAAASRSLLVLDYPSFSRLLREKAPRSASIAVLTALGAQPIVDATSGCRNWVQVHIQDLLGTALTLSAAPVPQTQPIQPIAA